MGLEDVELVMNIEDEFGISIPDSVAQDMRTVGEMYDTILSIVRSHGPEVVRRRVDLEEFVWTRLCQFAAELASGVNASEITRQTRFIEDLGYG